MKDFQKMRTDRHRNRGRFVLHLEYGSASRPWQQRRRRNALVEGRDSLFQKGQGCSSVLSQSANDTREPLGKGCSSFGFASLRYFSPDYRRSKSSFGPIVRRFDDIRMSYECPDRFQIASNIFAQCNGLGVFQSDAFAQQAFEARSNGSHRKLELVPRDQALPVAMPKLKGALDLHLPPPAQAFSAHSTIDQFLKIPLQMTEAELSAFLRNRSVGSPSIRGDDAGERAEQGFQSVAASPGIDSKQSCVGALSHPKPCSLVATAPTGFVCPGDIRRPHNGLDFLVRQAQRPIHLLFGTGNCSGGYIGRISDECFEKISRLPDTQVKTWSQMTDERGQTRSQERSPIFCRWFARCFCVAVGTFDRKTMDLAYDGRDARQLDLLPGVRTAYSRSGQLVTTMATGSWPADKKFGNSFWGKCLPPVAGMPLATATTRRTLRMSRPGRIRRRRTMAVRGIACQPCLQFLDQNFQLRNACLKFLQLLAVLTFIFHNSIVRIFL